MTEEFEALRARIAAEHQVLVGPDDPILMLVTAQEFCLQRSLQTIESAHVRALSLQTQQLEHALQKWTAAARTSSQETVNGAATAIKDAAATSAAAASNTIQETVSALITPLRLALLACLCSSLLSLLACALLWLR